MRRALTYSAVAASVIWLGCATLEGAQLYQSGTRALRAGDADQAVRDLERAAVAVPQASEIQNHLGLAYEAKGREVEALAAFERAVELDCDNRAAYINRARLRAHGDPR